MRLPHRWGTLEALLVLVGEEAGAEAGAAGLLEAGAGLQHAHARR